MHDISSVTPPFPHQKKKVLKEKEWPCHITVYSQNPFSMRLIHLDF